MNDLDQSTNFEPMDTFHYDDYDERAQNNF